jgi:AraC family transcriptional regulator, arabinose operon regulatory protein
VVYDFFIETAGRKWEKKWVRRLVEPREAFPVMIRYAGAARWPSEVGVSRTNSDLFAIEYVCGGNALFVQDGKEYVIERGSAYLLRMHGDHTYKAGTAGILFKRFVTIDGYDLENILRYLRLWERDYVVLDKPLEIIDLFKRCERVLSQPSDPKMDVALSALAYEMILVLSKSARTRYPDKVEHVLEFMYANLHRTLSRDEICKHAGLSSAQLNRLFASYLHRSPMGYFIELKMSWAISMITSTLMSVKEIAYRLGFGDPFHFSVMFKKRFGVSPKVYRELNHRK